MKILDWTDEHIEHLLYHWIKSPLVKALEQESTGEQKRLTLQLLQFGLWFLPVPVIAILPISTA